jgi:hypothetical protein
VSADNFNVEAFEEKLHDPEAFNEEMKLEKPILVYDEQQQFPDDESADYLEDPFQMLVRDGDNGNTLGMSARKKTYVFMLHGRKLVYWVQGEDRVGLVQDNVVARRLRVLSNESFVYLSQKDQNDPGEIKKVQIHYLTHQVTNLYTLDSHGDS